MNDKMAIFIFSVNVINWLLLSFLVLTKVITLSGVHCTEKCTVWGSVQTKKRRFLLAILCKVVVADQLIQYIW